MFERRFKTSQGQPWRVWAVRPATVAEERRSGDRRTPPAARLAVEPPGVDRRTGVERRVLGDWPAHFRVSHVLPEAWRDGWLVFEPDGTSIEVPRRLPTVPSDWQECDAAQLELYLERAEVGRRRSA